METQRMTFKFHIKLLASRGDATNDVLDFQLWPVFYLINAKKVFTHHRIDFKIFIMYFEVFGMGWWRDKTNRICDDDLSYIRLVGRRDNFLILEGTTTRMEERHQTYRHIYNRWSNLVLNKLSCELLAREHFVGLTINPPAHAGQAPSWALLKSHSMVFTTRLCCDLMTCNVCAARRAFPGVYSIHIDGTVSLCWLE